MTEPWIINSSSKFWLDNFRQVPNSEQSSVSLHGDGRPEATSLQGFRGCHMSDVIPQQGAMQMKGEYNTESSWLQETGLLLGSEQGLSAAKEKHTIPSP